MFVVLLTVAAKVCGSPSRTDAVAGATVTVMSREGAVAGLILRVRHSPGTTRREATRDASETGCESECGVREVSCLVPLQRPLHALCQCGASEKNALARKAAAQVGAQRNSRKARAISVLLIFDFWISRMRWESERPSISALTATSCQVGKSNREALIQFGAVLQVVGFR